MNHDKKRYQDYWEGYEDGFNRASKIAMEIMKGKSIKRSLSSKDFALEDQEDIPYEEWHDHDDHLQSIERVLFS